MMERGWEKPRRQAERDPQRQQHGSGTEERRRGVGVAEEGSEWRGGGSGPIAARRGRRGRGGEGRGGGREGEEWTGEEAEQRGVGLGKEKGVALLREEMAG